LFEDLNLIQKIGKQNFGGFDVLKSQVSAAACRAVFAIVANIAFCDVTQ